jgi:hypothetical protein
MIQNVFLTDERRAIINDASDLEGQMLANEKRRIREDAKHALLELEEIAQSSEIQNRSVFPPELIGRLVFWMYQDAGSLETATTPEDVPDSVTAYTKAHEEYMTNLTSEITTHLAHLEVSSERL